MKLKLDIESISEEFFCDSRLLGVITSAKCYHFCWQINAALGFRFRLNPTNEIKLQRKDRRYFFHVYEFKETSNYLTHYLYNNQFDGEYLLPEFKHIDFLWLIKELPTAMQGKSMGVP